MDPRLNWNNLDVVGPPGSFFQLTDSTDQRQLWVPPIYVGNARSVEKANSQQESSVTFLNSNGRASSTFR